MTGFITIIILCVLLCPLSLVFIAFSAIINHIRGSNHGAGELITAAIGAVLLFIGFYHSQPYIPPVLHQLFTDITQSHALQPQQLITLWLKGNLTTLGIATIIEQLCIFFLSMTPERMMLLAEERNVKRKLRRQKIDYVPTRSQVIYGVSGAGKVLLSEKLLKRLSARIRIL